MTETQVQVKLRAALYAVDMSAMGPDQKRFGREYACYLAGERPEMPNPVFRGDEAKKLVDFYMLRG